MKYNNEGDLIVALTFSDSMSIDSTIFSSVGGSDIVLLCFDSTGLLKRQIGYGSKDDENVSSLFLDEEMIYFGGELLGATSNRDIGRHKFILLSNDISTPYITFLTTSDLLSNQERQSLKQNVGVNTVEPKIVVFPNPVNQELIVRITGVPKKEYCVKMFDMVGKLIRNSCNTSFETGNDIHISNLESIPTGVYMVEVLCENEPVLHTKIVKK
jgi:hypothetical protein